MSGPDGVSRTMALLTPAPDGAAVALALRHAEREAIPPYGYGNDVPLTRQGIRSSRRLGEALSSRPVAVVRTSPLPRCVQTAENIIAGAGWDAVAVPDQRLSAPGPFVVASELAGPLFLEIGPEGVVERQLADATPPDGMRSAAEGVGLLLDLLIPHPKTQGRLGLFVTHDAVLAVLVGSLYGLHVGGFAWPDYLDAPWFCGGIQTGYASAGAVWARVLTQSAVRWTASMADTFGTCPSTRRAFSTEKASRWPSSPGR